MNLVPLPFVIFAISLLPLCIISFHSKWPFVFYRFDGTYLLIVAEMQHRWHPNWIDYSNNPLQGLGGFGLFWHVLWDPALWLVPRLPPSVAPTVAMTLYAGCLAAATCWLAVSLGLRAIAAVAAAWIGLLIALPFVYPTLGFDFLWGVPTDLLYIALATAAILLFLEVGRRSARADTLRIAGITAICSYMLLQVPAFAPICLIPVGVFGLAAVVGATSIRERLIKLAAGIGLVLLMVLAFGPMLYGMWGFNKATFFWYEFLPRSAQLRDQSFFITVASKWPAWLVYAMSLLGALHAVMWKSGHLRTLGGGFICFVAGNLLLLAAVGSTWKGPRIAYIDVFAYPFYCVFAAYAGAVILSHLGPYLPGYFPSALLVSALPWLVMVDLRPRPLDRPMVRNENPFVWPPGETPVSKFLAAEIGLRPGSSFRGRVASIAGSDFEREWLHVPAITQHNYDAMNLFYSGNDHRMYGMWYYDIPTLLEANQFTSPFFHLLNARLLNAPGTLDSRSYEVQSTVNDRIMALLGVRYLVFDKVLAGRAPALHHRLVEGRDLYIYPVPDANIAGYSVTRAHAAPNAQDAVTWLADATNDVRTAAVLTRPEALPPLVPATRSSLVAERGGYRISAESPGTSLLVLPLEFTHCLKAKLATNGPQRPRILRANLSMAAVLFTGRVDGTLQFRNGVWSSRCRLDDWREADALRLGEARDWPRMPNSSREAR
jgi:hypothetical protein